MNHTEYVTLKRIRDLGQGVCVDDPSDLESDALRTLTIRGYIESEIRIRNRNIIDRILAYSITDLGLVALSDFEEALERQRQQSAYHEAQRKIDRIDAESIAARGRHSALISAILGGIVGGAFSIICEHFPEILRLARRLLGL